MVAKVGALILALERLHRQHQVPLRAHRVEALERLLVERLAPVGPVIQQHAYRDTPRRDLLEGAEQVVGRCIGLQDVELDVHVPVGLAHRIGHRVQALLIVGDQVRRVVAGERHRTEIAIERHHRGEPIGRMRSQCSEVERRARVVDVGVDLVLHAAALARKTRIADQQEKEDADERDEVDRQQPRHRGGRSAIARHDDDRRDADGEVCDEDEDHPPRRIERDRHSGGLPAPACPQRTGSTGQGSDAVGAPAAGRAWRALPPRCARRRDARCGRRAGCCAG